MKTLIAFLLGIMCSISLLAQQKASCCSPSATETFSQLGSDKSFAMSHQNPLPFLYKGEEGQAIVYKTPDGSDAYAWELKSKKPSNNYVFVIHEWWGLNDYIKKESEQLWKDLGNVNVIALDLYDQKVASTREDAAKYMQQVTNERAMNLINGAIQYVGKNAKIYTIGWCFGGGWSLQASLLAGKQAAGCVMYYGMPEKDLEKLKTLHADVLGIFGNKDQWINPKVVDEFAASMKNAGKKLIVKRYEADHAFANPSNPSFDKAAKEDAYKNAISFLKERSK
jgi:carboxymethylenebutenolidase